MFDDNTSREAADRLGQIWDDVTRANGNNSAPNNEDAAFAEYLQRLTPQLDDTARGRMRARVLASQRGATDSMAHTASFDSRGLIASLPQQPRTAAKRPRLGPLDSPLMRIAAMILLALAIAGTWFGLRSFNGGDETPTPVQGALIATPEPGTDEVGSRETVLLYQVAAVGESREFTASISRVTLPAGDVWDFSAVTLSVDAFPIGFYVESGTLTFTDRGVGSTEGQGTGDVGAGGPYNSGIPSSLKNNGSEPVTFIMLVLHTDGDILPEAPESATSELLGDVPISQPPDSVTSINLSQNLSSTPGSDPIGASDNETVAFVAVNSGQMTVHLDQGAVVGKGTIGGGSTGFAPSTGAPIVLKSGETITADSGSSINGQARQEGTDTVSAYVLTIQQHSSEAVVRQQPADGATINWTIPAGSETAGVIMRTITLDPGAEWSYQFDGVVQYQLGYGEVAVGLGSDDLTQLTTGQYLSQSGSGELVIRNTGTTIADLLQVSMNIGTLTSDDIGGVPPDGVFRHFITGGQVPVTPGDIEIHLNKQSVSTGSTLSTDSEPGASIIAVYPGTIAFTPIRGDISIVPQTERGANVPSPATVPAAGLPASLYSGDAAIVPEGASYSLTGYGSGDSQLLWFWFEPVEIHTTPIAGN